MVAVVIVLVMGLPVYEVQALAFKILYSMLYPVIGEPPLSVGIVHVIVTCVFPGVALEIVGALGVVGAAAGVESTVAEGDPVPALLMADILNS